MYAKVLGAVLGLGIISGAIVAAAPAQAATVGGVSVPAPAQSPPLGMTTAISRVAVQYNLGSPLGPTVTGMKDGGAYRQFQRGFVVYSPATGAQVSRGAIRTAYAKLGYEKGRMGYPTSGELLSANKTITYQRYQHGTIVWNAKAGAHAIFGAIGTKWVAAGGANGSLGYPTSDETGLNGRGASQSFQGGTVVWSSFTGAHIMKGAIRTVWIKNGAQAGQPGYPVTDEQALPLGGVIQFFEGGASITWTAKGGAVVNPGVPHSNI
ncbi:LGFP repeat-containing protein [Arthrobacter sp. U41]|uniref:LGFP repeat-containing protein n=1 Tax=Arthrobacter sp. U41 TaxID=1849032 RepID=UPI0011A54894|nr:hypothetical protein [Arthrobacter sp. U41]